MPGRRPSEFEQRVYRALSQVPAGHVTTYGLLAAHLGCRSPRAVGQALKRNPFAPRVPCHRVIASDLTIGGFSGERNGPEIEAKLALLRQEGVCLDGGKLQDATRLYRFNEQRE
jgi:methylated-DNA-[protein]-cysteine S-methyltransferase